MYSYSRKFPIKIIPHVTELGEINDIIHNFKHPKMHEDKPEEKVKKSEEEMEDEEHD